MSDNKTPKLSPEMRETVRDWTEIPHPEQLFTAIAEFLVAHDAEVAANALEEAACDLRMPIGRPGMTGEIQEWLRARAAVSETNNEGLIDTNPHDNTTGKDEQR